MAARARIVTNPVAGERLTWLVTSEQTGGRMAIDCDGGLTVLGPGESLVVPPGVPRSWWNTRAGELCVHVEISHGDDAAADAGVSPLAPSGTLPVRWRSWSWWNESLTGSARWAWR